MVVYDIHETRLRLLNGLISGVGKSVLVLGDMINSPLPKSLRLNHYVTTVDVIEGADIKYDLEQGLPDWIGKFDVVMAGEFFEHIYHLKKLLIGIKGLLKEDGCLILSVPNTTGLISRFRVLFGHVPFNHAYGDRYDGEVAFTGHVRDFNLHEIKWYLKGAGFKITSIKSVGVWLQGLHLILPHWCCPNGWSDILIVKAEKKELVKS